MQNPVLSIVFHISARNSVANFACCFRNFASYFEQNFQNIHKCVSYSLLKSVHDFNSRPAVLAKLLWRCVMLPAHFTRISTLKVPLITII